MENVEQTIMSQFGNSPTILQLISNMNAYIDPATDFDAFYDFVWNVDTARGFGLDIWGRIVNIGRTVTIPGTFNYFGFKEAFTTPTDIQGPQPFGQASFFAGATTSSTFSLLDDAYRTLVLTKALANISDCTAPSLNQLLRNLFAGRGSVFVEDLGNMRMSFVFGFHLQPFEIAILTTSGAVPNPAAVSVSIQAP